MRVVHITPYFAPAFVYGGPPRSILALCQGLQLNGIDVEVVTTVANGSTDLRASSDASVRDLYDGVPVHYARRTFPPVYFNAAVGEAVQDALRRADLCHIHGLWNVPSWIGARAAERMGVPYVLSPRGMLQPAALERSRWRKRVAFQIFERQHLERAIRLHATVDAEAVVLRQMIDPSRVVTIPNAVNLSGANHARPGARGRLGVKADEPLVLFLGRLHPIKRLDLVTEAFAQVLRDHPAARLVLAGPDEGGLQSLRPLFSRLGVSPIITGALDDEAKWSLLREANVLVLCSDSENFGTSVAEALAAGCPVVATQTCPWQVIADERCGLWVPQDVRSIAAAIGSIIGDPRAAAAMGERGRRVAVSRYDKRAIGAEMLACYNAALSVGRRVA